MLVGLGLCTSGLASQATPSPCSATVSNHGYRILAARLYAAPAPTPSDPEYLLFFHLNRTVPTQPSGAKKAGALFDCVGPIPDPPKDIGNGGHAGWGVSGTPNCYAERAFFPGDGTGRPADRLFVPPHAGGRYKITIFVGSARLVTHTRVRKAANELDVDLDVYHQFGCANPQP